MYNIEKSDVFFFKCNSTVYYNLKWLVKHPGWYDKKGKVVTMKSKLYDSC